MKLQAGKSYYRRDGGVESIVRVQHKMAFNTNGNWWHEDGGRHNTMMAYDGLRSALKELEK